MITSNTPIAAPCTCPTCGRVMPTEPVLPVLPKPSSTVTIGEYVPRPMPKEETDRWGRIYRLGRWITID